MVAVRRNKTATRKSTRTTREEPTTNGENGHVENERLNLLIPGDLKRFAFEYAKKKKTTVTQLIKDHFVALQEKENEHAG